MIKVGGHVFLDKAVGNDPEAYARCAKEMGYSAVYAPPWLTIDKPDEIRMARKVFERENLIVAEAGYWENPLDTREEVRREVRREMVRVYQMAEELGAGCVVNTAGSYCEGLGYCNHNPKNFSEEHFEAAVEMARYFIDEVHPKTTFFTYEVFMYNSIDSPESYERILRAADRDKFGAHIDLTNMMRSPREVYMADVLTKKCISMFGDRIVSAHIKDARLVRPAITTKIEEALPGTGEADLAAFIVGLGRLSNTVTMMTEHLNGRDEYQRAFDYIKKTAVDNGLTV